MATVTISFCRKNLELYSQSVHDAMRERYPDVEIEIKDCLDRCGTCTDIPFAVRLGGVVGGRDARDLYRKLERGMRFLSRPPLPGTADYREEAEAPVPVAAAKE